jgi:hypothetical protein
VQEIAQCVDIPLARVRWSLEYTPERVSIDNPLPGRVRALRHVLPDTPAPSSHEVLIQHHLRRQEDRVVPGVPAAMSRYETKGQCTWS